MKLTFVTLLCLFSLVFSPLTAQERHGSGERMRPSPGRIEKFKTMRLIEVLKLSEEDAARFTAKQRSHTEAIRDLMDRRNELLDSLDGSLRAKAGQGDLAGPTDAVLDIDRKIVGERERYYGELRKFFSKEQFARFIIFDRNFNRRVHDAIEEMRGQRGPGSPE